MRRWLARTGALPLGATLALLAAGCADRPAINATGDPKPSSVAAPAALASGGTTVVAVGDIACPGCKDEETARLTASLKPRIVLTLGDLQYETGAYGDFLRYYDKSWGRFKSITRPVPGNHEYSGGSADGYYRYFGAAAHPRKGYYSYDLGGWHFVALNSSCGGAGVGGCGPNSPQTRWLKADLAASRNTCTLAYWHQPRFSSGLHGSNRSYDAFWRALYADGAEIALAGHEHSYERFAPLDPSQRPDAKGVRGFIVGTGGKTLYPILSAVRGSEVRNDSSYGVLKLTLRSGGYDWRFVTVGGRVADSGSGRCH